MSDNFPIKIIAMPKIDLGPQLHQFRYQNIIFCRVLKSLCIKEFLIKELFLFKINGDNPIQNSAMHWVHSALWQNQYFSDFHSSSLKEICHCIDLYSFTSQLKQFFSNLFMTAQPQNPIMHWVNTWRKRKRSKMEKQIPKGIYNFFLEWKKG